MAYRRSYGMRSFRRRYNRRRRNYGTRGTVTRRWMPSRVWANKTQQMDVRTMYFRVGDIKLGPEPGESYIQAAYRTRNLYDFPNATWRIPELENMVQIYDEYKVLAIKITWHPMNIYSGGASTQTQNTPLEPYIFRGNTASYTDQRWRDPVQNPTEISQMVNFSSFRMHDSNRRFSRTLYRPKSATRWGQCTDITQPVPRALDSWDGAIFILQQNLQANDSIQEQELWYAVYELKFIFRGRRSPL